MIGCISILSVIALWHSSLKRGDTELFARLFSNATSNRWRVGWLITIKSWPNIQRKRFQLFLVSKHNNYFSWRKTTSSYLPSVERHFKGLCKGHSIQSRTNRKSNCHSAKNTGNNYNFISVTVLNNTEFYRN